MSAEKKHASKPASKDEGQQPPAPPDVAMAPEAGGEGQKQEETLNEVRIEDVQALETELEKAQAKAAENFEGWQRERADFLNYKKRVERDQAQSMQNITGNILKKYLVILDDLERALKARPTQGEDAAWAEGIELIYRKLQNIIEAEGVRRIPAESEMFDPSRHEAVTHEASADHKSGQVIEVLQQGYTLGDRVLRPAMVRVAQ